MTNLKNSLLKAFLTAFAFVAVFHVPLQEGHYESKVDFLTASVYELLGSYDFTFVLLFVVCGFFYYHVGRLQKGNGLLAVFFAFCLLIGRSYNEVGNWSYCFGSLVNFAKFVLALCGYAVLFKTLFGMLEQAMAKKTLISEKEHFFSNRAFLKSFLIIFACYVPFLIVSYPGNLCWDVAGQIEQVILQKGYSAHHPLLHTLIVGGVTQLGMTLFGSYEVGLFLYVWLQTMLLVGAMAATIAVLAKRKVNFKVLLCLMLLYIVTPIYTNLATTALKDVPFTAFVIGYLICYALLLETPQFMKNIKFVILFVILQVGVILLRNNGLPLVLLSGIGGFLFTLRKYDFKDKIKSLLVQFGAGVVIGSLCLSLLSNICNATAGSKGEMLSIFFQQTARYLQFYQTELEAEERQAIEAVLGDVATVAAVYDPDISDPVKALFKKDASTDELVQYLTVWFKGFFKHPAVYFEAFFAHIYGWFTPGVDNAIRYEIQYDVIQQGLLFPDADKVMIFFYRFANRFSLLGVLENIGMAVWALFFYSNYQRRNGGKGYLAASLPLWVSLLICMASPCFFGHPRYALPILMGIPFLYGFALSGRSKLQE